MYLVFVWQTMATRDHLIHLSKNPNLYHYHYPGCCFKLLVENMPMTTFSSRLALFIVMASLSSGLVVDGVVVPEKLPV